MEIKKLITYLLVTLILIVGAIFLIFYRPVSLLGDTLYEVVYTGSMEPTIPVGSVVGIKKVNLESLSVGDVICFKLSQPTSITHRIINITDDGFVTKGDANENPDQWIVKKENVIGKIMFTIPYLGYLSRFVRTSVGFILFIITPATILLICEIRSLMKKVNKN